MKIGIIGGSGKTGSAVYQEAQKRGHEPTAFVRSEEKGHAVLGADARLLVKDAFELTKADLTQFDVIIDAFAVPMGSGTSYLHLDLLTQLVHELRQTETRLFVIIGAASLKLEDGRRLLDQLLAMPDHEKWIGTPLNQTYELEFLQMVDNVDWVAVSPQRNFGPGPTNGYVMGTDKIMVDSNGKSELSNGNMALAILDEIETPKHRHQRFTVRNQEVK
ncbi:NAD(P)H-binding protein [Secundilactobacillus folii]|uniref:NAD(P)H-binding protein n=1 Tax=Secundilactobacillus folii TaxID=2678357 RepID=A0A7X2XW62_9LACO|nr:NAD(P)H-binding protein [Secundilactobacillus folii]MTV82793.1 NAD(P)H-binding protein [Secundilactobacillus folii]